MGYTAGGSHVVCFSFLTGKAVGKRLCVICLRQGYRETAAYQPKFHQVCKLFPFNLAEVPSLNIFCCGIGSSGLYEVVNEDLCRDLGKGSKTMRCGKVVVKLAKAKSGLEVVFHLPDLKLFGWYGSWRRVRSAMDAQSSKAEPLGLVAWYPHAVLWQLKSPA